jgi:ribosomal protein S27E
MPKKLSKAKEEDIEPLESDSVQAQEQAQQQAIVPANDPYAIRALPEKDHVITHIDGSPIYYSEAAHFGGLFFKLIGQGMKIMGQDRAPQPKGAEHEYLRVTCEGCKQVTVTVAPHTEKFCSGCGATLPVPSSHTPVAVPERRFGDDGGEVVDAEVVEDA